MGILSHYRDIEHDKTIHAVLEMAEVHWGSLVGDVFRDKKFTLFIF